jgi:hypothetical protein
MLGTYLSWRLHVLNEGNLEERSKEVNNAAVVVDARDMVSLRNGLDRKLLTAK